MVQLIAPNTTQKQITAGQTLSLQCGMTLPQDPKTCSIKHDQKKKKKKKRYSKTELNGNDLLKWNGIEALEASSRSIYVAVNKRNVYCRWHPFW